MVISINSYAIVLLLFFRILNCKKRTNNCQIIIYICSNCLGIVKTYMEHFGGSINLYNVEQGRYTKILIERNFRD